MKCVGAERFQGRFGPIQPAYANRLYRRDPTEVNALGVEPPTTSSSALEDPSNSLLQAQQLRQPLAGQLLGICSASPPTLKGSAVATQRLRELFFADALEISPTYRVRREASP